MPTIAYITNQFPAAVEWYVVDEIMELRRRGVKVIPCSGQRVRLEALPQELRMFAHESLALRPIRADLLLRALWMCASNIALLRDLLGKTFRHSPESLGRRVRTLAHTLLGAYYAALLRNRGVEHIHVHHGYFASWVAMVAARFLGVTFSMTLHGSDLLVHGVHMERKLVECKFCLTVSEFNRRHILAHYPAVDPEKILLRRMGVDLPRRAPTRLQPSIATPVLLSAGRLHPVKDHVFLLRACYFLRECGLQFRCLIVGDGPERRKLEFLIGELGIGDIVTLVGHVPHSEISDVYENADLVILTSQSEGIPLVLMEAMARKKLVLAPAITGISELVFDGKNGFLYQPGVLEDFVWRVMEICESLRALDSVRRNAREHVRVHFNRQTNLQSFADLFLEQIGQGVGSCADENPVLQQI
jgi:glycosyltransferase involved in cell wall biosynthesis